VLWVARTTGHIATRLGERRVEPELLRCDLAVARVTQVAGVAVIVAATKREGLDVVDLGRFFDATGSKAALAQTFGPLEASQPLLLTSATT
jgi:hypothetical protein